MDSKVLQFLLEMQLYQVSNTSRLARFGSTIFRNKTTNIKQNWMHLLNQLSILAFLVRVFPNSRTYQAIINQYSKNSNNSTLFATIHLWQFEGLGTSWCARHRRPTLSGFFRQTNHADDIFWFEGYRVDVSLATKRQQWKHLMEIKGFWKYLR